MSDKYPFTAEYLVNFEKATVELKNGVMTLYTDDEVEEIDISCEKTGLPSENGYVNELVDFISCIRNNTESETNPAKSSKASLEIAFAEKKSAALGKTVEL